MSNKNYNYDGRVVNLLPFNGGYISLENVSLCLQLTVNNAQNVATLYVTTVALHKSHDEWVFKGALVLGLPLLLSSSASHHVSSLAWAGCNLL